MRCGRIKPGLAGMGLSALGKCHNVGAFGETRVESWGIVHARDRLQGPGNPRDPKSAADKRRGVHFSKNVALRVQYVVRYGNVG